MEILQKIRFGNIVPALAAGAMFYGDEKISGEYVDPTPPAPDYSTMYLTFESLEDGNTITFTKEYNAVNNTLYYSTDDGATWNTTNDTTTWSITSTGGKIMFKAWPSIGCWGKPSSGSWIFTSTKTLNVYGNIMSMLYGDNFIGQTSLPTITSSTYGTFCSLFKNLKVVDASNLILPATTLARSCYSWMFQNCTSLTTAPELPAPTLVNGCYNGMFYGCSSLNYIKCLATDIGGNTSNWVNGVGSGGTFVKAASMTGWSTGNNGIPSSWTVEDAA